MGNSGGCKSPGPIRSYIVTKNVGCVSDDKTLSFDECNGYIALSPEDMQLVLDKLKQCEVEEDNF